MESKNLTNVSALTIQTGIPAIVPGLKFKSKALQTAYNGILEESATAAAQITEYGMQADSVRNAWDRRVALALARLPRKNGKLDPDKCDGLKTVGEFGEKIGLKSGKANGLANYGKFLEDPTVPEEAKLLTWSNYAEIQSAYKKVPEEVIKAFKDETLTHTTPQKALGEWADKVTATANKPKVVTLLQLWFFGSSTPEPDEPKTMEEWDKLYSSDGPYEFINLPAVKIEKDGKTLSARRKLMLNHENGKYLVFQFIPVPKEEKKPLKDSSKDTSRYDKWNAAKAALAALNVSDETAEAILKAQYPEFYPDGNK